MSEVMAIVRCLWIRNQEWEIGLMRAEYILQGPEVCCEFGGALLRGGSVIHTLSSPIPLPLLTLPLLYRISSGRSPQFNCRRGRATSTTTIWRIESNRQMIWKKILDQEIKKQITLLKWSNIIYIAHIDIYLSIYLSVYVYVDMCM